MLKSRLEAAKSATAAGSKRKRQDADVVPYSREVKKGRKEAEEKREVFLGGLVIEEVDAGEGDEGGELFFFCWLVAGDWVGRLTVWFPVQDLMRKLYQIGLYFKPGLQVHPKDLASHLRASAADISKVVLHAVDQQSSADVQNATDLFTTMTAAGRVVASILAGSQKLIRMPGGEALAGKVTYALVQMYGKLLTGFDTISKAETSADVPAENSTDAKISSAKQKPKAKGGAHRVNIRDVPCMNALASLLSGIMRQLDARQDWHRDLFEGFLYNILSRLGNRIYTINFSQPRAASIAEETEANLSAVDPDSESNPPFTDKDKRATLSVRQAHLEAPYMLHLLKNSLALTPSFLSPASNSRDNNSSTTTSKPNKSKPTPKPGSVTKTSLSLAAKERLQATLVNAIFGPEGLDEESDLFLNDLQLPPAEACGGSFTVPRVEEVEVGEWFQGEVWRLLGWEVLGREMDLRGRG